VIDFVNFEIFTPNKYTYIQGHLLPNKNQKLQIWTFRI